ncbi:MAG TPA: potassium-transporting ATPase subunit KdpA [Caldisericia bacterium]|nr:MAG: Potassium-transporting ATPase A chain [bacterium ADurb.Bin132]HNW31149.1 potassium-transporting ATPase subunit KdpA [Caldisericia bacterium]HNY61936.1 potassium-transporting ATPase subunit KdpA [Caldisericia bacterium]HOC80033.1 potassium-transporting ATPase subunit KdpA [Caldisericia bacterium]HOG71003.1 potassium-transporting ATPase subunit KdpA [Caldisericia bacterium]
MIAGELMVVALIIFATIACAYPFGIYMAKVFGGEKTFMSKVMRPVENFFYKFAGIKENDKQNWKQYLKSFVLFFGLGFVILFAILSVQKWLPMNPSGFGNIRWDTGLNIATSFCTNTNWQSVSFEASLTPFSQMIGIAVQNFVSAAAGLAVGVALVRGFARKNTDKIGNFWVDLTRGVLYVLVPISLVVAIFLVWQGVPQTLGNTIQATTIQGQSQTIITGPVASQVSIKMLGSNGGGYFNANGAHPFENPTPLSNAIQTMAILFIPMSLLFTFGKMIGDMKKAWSLFFVCIFLFVIGLSITMYAEMSPNPVLRNAGVASGLNMEGKEMRFGIPSSALWGQSTTVVSNGSVNGMHDSFMPLSGLVYIFNMITGEVIFGGVGVGLASLLLYSILAMFIAGLMIGKTPELLRKKLGVNEMVWACVGLLTPCIVVLILTAIGFVTPSALSSLSAKGSHGFSQLLYANTSMVGNNGSAFGGLAANTPFFNLTGSFAMLFGRFATVVSAIAVAGSLAKKNQSPANSTQIPMTSPAFVVMLLAVIIIVGALTFFPSLAIGPLLEHLKMAGM